jgi:cadmium resistance protein CadD (predicted permease)
MDLAWLQLIGVTSFGAHGAQTVSVAVSAFSASNLDDIVLLLLFFSGLGTAAGKANSPWPVVAGQYLGFGVLVAASLIGSLGGMALPTGWIGMLGLLPISLGVSQLIDNLAANEDDAADGGGSKKPLQPSNPDQPTMPGAFASPWPWLNLLSPLSRPMVSVAAVTIANGGDNIGLYLPLFARSTPNQVLITVVVFLLMVGLWCAMAWWLVRSPALADLLTSNGNRITPFVLIGLGGLILIDSDTLQHRGLAALALSGIALMALSLLRQLQLVASPEPQTVLSQHR